MSGCIELGHCHSVEVWQDGDLVGGLYGVSLGRAFFGESMFHRARDASKVALVHLVARLIAGGFELLDTQYVTEHLRSFGAVEIPRRRYRTLLDKAIAGEPAEFLKLPAGQPVSGADALAIVAHRAALIPEQSAKQPAGPLLRRGWRRLLLLLELRLRRHPDGGRGPPASAAADASARAAGRRLRRFGRRADDGLVGAFAVGQPDIVDRVLDAMQAGACSIHPARENPLHLALQRDLVDLDKGVGVGGFGGRPRVAGAGLDPQRAELHGLADILVEIDDAPGDLVEAREARLLVGDLGGRRLGHDLVAGLQGRRRLRHALGLTLARRAGLPGGGALATPGWPGCGGCTAMPGWVPCGTTVVPGGGANGCDCTASGRRHALPRRRRFGVGNSRPRGNSGTSSSSSGIAARAAVAGCRAGWRPAAAAEDPKRYCRSARAPGAQARLSWRPPGPQNRSGQWFETSRGFKRRIGLATLYRLIRRSRATRLTRRIRREHDGTNFVGISTSHATSSLLKSVMTALFPHLTRPLCGKKFQRSLLEGGKLSY